MSWPFVDADDDLVADLLAGTVEAVLELGGWLHPRARLVARAGQVHVACDAPDGDPLMRVPVEAFVRVGRVTWSGSGEALEVLDVPDDITDAEHELLILQTALHNACGKVPSIVATHPVLDPLLDPAVVDAVRAFRPSFRLRQPSPAGLLWSTRAFRLPTLQSSAPEPVAVPLVDLLDHRPGGATALWTGDAFAVEVRQTRDNGEQATWLDYGLQRDAIGMAVVYGFTDEGNPVAHAAPMGIEVPGVGPVRVQAVGRTRTGELLPTRVRREGDALMLSHLTFGLGSPDDLAAVLAAAAECELGTARAVVRAVAYRCLHLADALAAAADAAPSAGADVLGGAARRYREVAAPYASAAAG